MLKFCVSLSLLVLLTTLPAVSLGQNESVLNRSGDENARTRAEREQTRDILLNAAQQVRTSDPAKAAGFFNRAARLQFLLNSSKEALLSYRSALTLLDRFPEPVTRIDSLNGTAVVLAQLGKCDQAQRYIHQALSLREKHQNVVGKAEALLTLSDCQNSI